MEPPRKGIAEFVGPGHFPEQCPTCGNLLLLMGCATCSPPELPRSAIVRNNGGFPKTGQLSITPSPPGGRPKPRERKGRTAERPVFLRNYKFRGEDDNLMSVPDGEGCAKPIIKYGQFLPLAGTVKKNETFNPLVKYMWGNHKWDTYDVPIDRETTLTALFKCICIHFLRFIQAMERCGDSNACLCGGPESTLKPEHIKVNEVHIFDASDTLVFLVDVSERPLGPCTPGQWDHILSMFSLTPDSPEQPPDEDEDNPYVIYVDHEW